MAVFCLDIHAAWRCQHAGACCRAGWAIPVEGPAFEALRLHFRDRSAESRFITGTTLPEGAAAMLATAADGACVFYEGRLCAIHRELGPDAMPVACQQFPRMALLDRRGTFVTLSHFCPTAAGLLLNAAGNLAVVPAPDSLVGSNTLEGLDATQELPPLLRPRLLTDLEGYGDWERECLRVLASEDSSAEQALDRIEAATRLILSWRPDDGSLSTAVRHAFSSGSHRGDGAWNASADEKRFELARAAVPEGLAAPRVPANLEVEWEAASKWWPSFGRASRRFAAAHLFGSWTAYQGSSLMTIVNVVKVALSVLRVEAARHTGNAGMPPEKCLIEAVRSADLLLIHLSDTPALVRAVENG